MRKLSGSRVPPRFSIVIIEAEVEVIVEGEEIEVAVAVEEGDSVIKKIIISIKEIGEVVEAIEEVMAVEKEVMVVEKEATVKAKEDIIKNTEEVEEEAAFTSKTIEEEATKNMDNRINITLRRTITNIFEGKLNETSNRKETQDSALLRKFV